MSKVKTKVALFVLIAFDSGFVLSVIITHQLISACSYWMKHVTWYNIRWRLCHFLSGLKAILEWAGYLDVNLGKV